MTIRDLRDTFAPGEIVKPVVTLTVVGIASWAVVRGIVLPEWYISLVLLVIGYWFGNRGQAPKGHKEPLKPARKSP